MLRGIPHDLFILIIETKQQLKYEIKKILYIELATNIHKVAISWVLDKNLSWSRNLIAFDNVNFRPEFKKLHTNQNNKSNKNTFCIYIHQL